MVDLRWRSCRSWHHALTSASSRCSRRRSSWAFGWMPSGSSSLAATSWFATSSARILRQALLRSGLSSRRRRSFSSSFAMVRLRRRIYSSVSPRMTATTIRGLLDRIHAGAADFELVIPEALLAQSRRTQRLFKIVMGCIAGISLLVGGIGIMNIMLATVLERTREIGVRRAVGARRDDIRRQFIIEAFSISLLGGLFGVAMGVAIARIVAAAAGWPTVVTTTSILLSTSVSQEFSAGIKTL